MTIQEMIDKLQKVPEDKRDLEIYVCDYDTANNYKIDSISVFDSDCEHNEENILGINFKK